ncbi:MAG: hypothetical protein EOO73_21400 [Myxococcales bacterium]|nr:MAG: hypothetical protein EOO73_21400 [Myxococcales bacterium]
MLSLGSISRSEASAHFPFLSARFRGRRSAIKEFTHRDPDFVFWIFPDGRLHDARRAHAANVPRGFEYILDDEPDYGGFLRGRVATDIDGNQLVVVYCRSEALAEPGPKLNQLLSGIRELPVPVNAGALVISDNADIYGTIDDLERRALAGA